eukprot:SM000036S13242  [mRNA]  locus=s36:117844:119722:+ [translate_table: standard]
MAASAAPPQPSLLSPAVERRSVAGAGSALRSALPLGPQLRQLQSCGGVVRHRRLAAAGPPPWQQWRQWRRWWAAASGGDCEPTSSGEPTGSSGTGGGDDDPVAAVVRLERLQRELDQAIMSEDYAAAAQLRDQLRRVQEDDEAGVLAANKLFYRAFEAGSVRQMEQVWAHGDHVQCIHPGSNCIAGRDLVMQSWDLVLGSARDLHIGLEDVRVLASGSLGVVTCVEVMQSTGSAGRLVATNIFKKQGGRWLIVLHHASPASPLM